MHKLFFEQELALINHYGLKKKEWKSIVSDIVNKAEDCCHHNDCFYPCCAMFRIKLAEIITNR